MRQLFAALLLSTAAGSVLAGPPQVTALPATECLDDEYNDHVYLSGKGEEAACILYILPDTQEQAGKARIFVDGKLVNLTLKNAASFPPALPRAFRRSTSTKSPATSRTTDASA